LSQSSRVKAATELRLGACCAIGQQFQTPAGRVQIAF